MKKENIIALFLSIINVHKFVIISGQDYSASNPKFVNFSKISGDTLQDSHGHIIYAAMIFRHGGTVSAPTPYPTDPYRNYFLPQNYQPVANSQKLLLNKIGQYCKGRYGSLTGHNYNCKKIKINSSNGTLVQESAGCFLSGFFPPTYSEIWNPHIYWQPIPIHVIPDKYDSIIDFAKKCPLKDKLRKQFYATNPKIKNICQKYGSILNYIQQNSELKLNPCNEENTFQEIRILLEILQLENSLFNLTLPSWTNAIYPEPLTTLVGQTYFIDVDDHEIRRLTCGPFFQLLMSEMNERAKNNISIPNAHVFASQATTLTALKRALNIYDNVFPPFGSTLVFELRKKNRENYVTVMVTNSTEEVPYVIEIPGCGAYCTLQKLEEITNSIIPQNWQDECNAVEAKNNQDKIFRHGGTISVIKSYPTDPYRNYFLPRNYQPIANNQKLLLNKVGQYFKSRYGPLTGETYNSKKIKINSSFYNLVQESAGCFLSGYFPPTCSEIWNPHIYWQPIPIHVIPNNYDNIIDYKSGCPLKDKLRKQFYAKNPKVNNICQKYGSLLNYIQQNSGFKLNSCHNKSTFHYIRTLLEIFQNEDLLFNLTLPSWTNAIYPEPLTTLVGQTYYIDIDDPEIRRLTCGPFFQLLTSEMNGRAKNNISIPNMHTFAGQATTLTVLKRALNIYDNVFPSFGSTLVFELRKKNRENYVTVIFTNSTEKVPYVIEIPGCGEYCTLQKFEEITNSIIPQNWQDECNADKKSNTKQQCQCN
ncbi:hypothetical protein PGB90_007013 [Kerria lacca]